MKFIKQNSGEYITADRKYRIVKFSRFWAVFERGESMVGIDTLKRAKEYVEYRAKIKAV